MRWLDGITDLMDMSENAYAGKERQDPCISVKYQLVEDAFIHSCLHSSKLTENLTLSTVTPTRPEPVSTRRQDGQSGLRTRLHAFNDRSLSSLSHHHRQPGTSSRLF